MPLLTLLRDPRHHLLVFADEPGPQLDARLGGFVLAHGDLVQPHVVARRAAGGGLAHADVWIDRHGVVGDRYGVRPAGCYLLRPDGHVAFRGTHLAAVDGYLRQLFRPA